MRVLVTYGSKLGGTKEIAEQVGEVLHDQGLEAVVRAPEERKSLTDSG
jgi:flavodoxin